MNLDAQFKAIVDAACEEYGLVPDDISGPCRKSEYVAARRAVEYLSYYALGLTLKDIGRRLGFDHTSVLSNVQNVRTGKVREYERDAMRRIRRAAWPPASPEPKKS